MLLLLGPHLMTIPAPHLNPPPHSFSPQQPSNNNNNNIETTADETPPPPPRKLRIAFVSSLFNAGEPHGLLLDRVIGSLPSHLFEIIIVAVGAHQASPSLISLATGGYHFTGFSYASAVGVLNAARLDCLVYGEMQNEASAHILGFHRFATVQILVMGAPVTSGNPSIDYFMSGDRLEFPFRTLFSGKQGHDLEHYSEQVVLLDGQAIGYPPNTDDARVPDTDGPLSDLSFWTDVLKVSPSHALAPKYCCPQNIFKLQPVFDEVLVRILVKHEDAVVVLQAADWPHWTETARERIRARAESMLCGDESAAAAVAAAAATTTATSASASFPPSPSPCSSSVVPSLMSRVTFTPRVTMPNFRRLLRTCDVILQPSPFDGSKTAMDAMFEGKTPITWPTEMLRGRLAGTFYDTIGAAGGGRDDGAQSDSDKDKEEGESEDEFSFETCCVAYGPLDYASKAVRLCQDSSYRSSVESVMKRRVWRIVDSSAMGQIAFEWTRFICRALDIRDECGVGRDKLRRMVGWKDVRTWQTEEKMADIFQSKQRLWRQREENERRETRETTQ